MDPGVPSLDAVLANAFIRGGKSNLIQVCAVLTHMNAPDSLTKGECLAAPGGFAPHETWRGLLGTAKPPSGCEADRPQSLPPKRTNAFGTTPRREGPGCILSMPR